MISKDLLLKKGTIEALVLSSEGDHVVSELATEMDVAEGTARQRMNELAEEGLVEVDATIIDGNAVKVYRASAGGTEAAELLTELLPETSDRLLDSSPSATRADAVLESDDE